MRSRLPVRVGEPRHADPHAGPRRAVAANTRDRRYWSALAIAGLGLVVRPARADEARVDDGTPSNGTLQPSTREEPPSNVIDRTVVRFTAPEIGGNGSPRFIFARVLAFEARLEALSDPSHRLRQEQPYTEVHVRVAMERHIAETLLAALSIDPKPTPAVVETQMGLARAMLANQVGGDEAIRAAARSEGIEIQELRRLLRRRALASLYLHHMVAPMLSPSDSQLRELHQKTPLLAQPFEKVKPELTRLYIGRALSQAVTAFYQNARSRLTVTILE